MILIEDRHGTLAGDYFDTLMNLTINMEPPQSEHWGTSSQERHRRG